MAPSVERAFAILDLLSRSPQALGASEVARRSRLAKSTTHGILRSLAAAGAVEQVGGRYRLGPAVGRLAAVAELRRRWRPLLEELARNSGETAFLGQLRGGRVAILDEVLGTGAPLVSAPVGSRLPASAGAVAAVLAGRPLAIDRGQYLEGVNAVAAAVPGGVVWVAGFAGRLDDAGLAQLEGLLRERTASG
jgi:DNA-binding IclR family transcriptional regulator